MILSRDDPTVVNSTDDPVEFRESGEIIPASGETSIELAYVYISSGSQVVATNVTVKRQLVMEDGASLSAKPGPGSKITFEEGVRILMQAKGAKMPFLDLGDIGSNYKIVPEIISIIPTFDTNSMDAEAWPQVLVSGATLSNCNEWLERANLSDTQNFELMCNNTAPAVRLLGGGDVISLLIKRRRGGSGPDDGLGTGATIGIVIGGIAAVAIAAVVVVFVLRRGNKKVSSSSVDSGSSEGGQAKE